MTMTTYEYCEEYQIGEMRYGIEDTRTRKPGMPIPLVRYAVWAWGMIIGGDDDLHEARTQMCANANERLDSEIRGLIKRLAACQSQRDDYIGEFRV